MTERPGAQPETRSTRALTSIVLPVHNQAEHIGRIVEGHIDALQVLPQPFEIVLVTNACTDDSVAVCSRLARAHEAVQVEDLGSDGGWGRAVKRGLHVARGDTLCYTNSARTTSEMLTLALVYAVAYPGAVVKANRRLRDNWRRRFGSLLYNLECRALFDLSTWDVNGTPKVFPRAFAKLLELRRDDDLVDAEFSLVCKQQGYPVIEVPLLETERHGGKSTTNYRSAVHMYVGAYRLRKDSAR